MDNKITMENLVNAIKVVRNNQKAQAVKIVELDKQFEIVKSIHDRLSILEEDLDKQKKENDIRFDKAIYRSDNINGVIDDHIDGIADLEEKYSLILKIMEVIGWAIDKFDHEINVLEKTSAQNDRKENEVKTCKLNNFGYCKSGSDYKFCHSDEKFEIYMK